jgi:SAM-dependent methyltransferase
MNGAGARRGAFQGVLQILRFNRRFYLTSIAGITAALLVASQASPAWRAMLQGGCLLALFWTCSSLLVSYYVYDWFPLYQFNWLARLLPEAPGHWVNIHAGLDETSHLLSTLFPSAGGRVLDIYDPHEMTEHSIEEARRLLPSLERATPVLWNCLPLGSETLDIALLMFAAHELRRNEARVQLFHELARVLKSDGEVALIEHTRDWANFLAFGPGFLHFFSKRSWRRAASAARLQVRTEISMTPFVTIFMLRKAL